MIRAPAREPGGKVRLMKRWEEYQHQAAALLRELGFTAKVDAWLVEANGAIHAIDVAARRTVAGVDLLWIVECKYWSKPVDMGAVRDLRTLVLDLGADHGLLMSENAFQSGAVMAAKGKSLTLTSLDDLRANAADEILAARLALAEKRLMDLSLRVNRDLRPFTSRTEHRLASLAARLPPEVAEEFAARPEAIEYIPGLMEVASRVEGLTMEDVLAFNLHPGEMALPWRPGADAEVMDLVALALHYVTVAFYQGRLGQWPAFCVPVNVEPRLAWSMPQLLDVIEPKLLDLEGKVSEQEARADQTPRLPWFDFIKPGTLPPPHPWSRGIPE
jgi:hypothetical protein